MLKDLRLAIRSLLKQPSFSAVVVITLALGIGANTAIFSEVDGVLLSPLPYKEPERLVAVWARPTVKNLTNQPVSFLNYTDWKQQGAIFENLAAIRAESLNLTGLGEPERVNGVKTTVNILQTLGIRMALGAQRSEILGMVVRDGAKLALAGVALGVAGSLSLTRLMSGLLFGISATDPLTFVAMALLLMAVCIMAGGIPARRAARVNAIIALRGD